MSDRSTQGPEPWVRASSALLLVALLIWSPLPAAERWGGSVAALSDYVTRGLSLTRGDPAVQVSAYRQFGTGWSIGGAASTVDLGDWIDATHELSATLTRSWPLGERWSAYASYTRYIYPGERGDYDYGEWNASISYRNSLTATFAFFPDTSIYSRGRTAWRENAMSFEVATLQPLNERWSWLAGVGYYELPRPFDTGYWFWSAGIAFAWNALRVDLVHIDTGSTATRLFGSERAGNRWSAALMWTF